MKKKYLSFHLILFLILISTTIFFIYQSFFTKQNIDKELQKNEVVQNTKNIEQTEQVNSPIEEKSLSTLQNLSITNEISNDTTSTNIVTKETFTIIEPDKPKTSLPYYATIIVNNKSYTVGFAEQVITLKQLMDKLQAENNFTFSGVDYPSMGFFVTEINGIKNKTQENKYWIYYVNGVSAKAGISVQKINSQDKIEWKYENSTF